MLRVSVRESGRRGDLVGLSLVGRNTRCPHALPLPPHLLEQWPP